MYANFSEFGGNGFKGLLYDYQPKWYAIVGNKIVQTMIINAFMPILSEYIPKLKKELLQRFDQSWESNAQQRLYETKKTQIYSYMDLYSGPEFVAHFKYSAILNLTYVTMFYGPGLPILFPIAVLSYFLFYCVERFGLAYTYIMPPAMDDKLTKNALNLLSYLPLLFLLNGFLMFSNQQIFGGGFGLPILFPIAVLSYFIYYYAERLGLTYKNTVTSAMEDKLTKDALNLLSYLPLLLLLNGYWMFSDQQLFCEVVSNFVI